MSKQLLTVIRHGKRLDEVEALWRSTTERPWDPPLWDEGFVAVRAQCVTCRLPSQRSSENPVKHYENLVR